MVEKRTTKSAVDRANARKLATPPVRLRIPLNTIDDVRREMGKLYREARAKRVDTQDASRMANMLSILGRLIEGSDLEARLDAVERATQKEIGNGQQIIHRPRRVG